MDSESQLQRNDLIKTVRGLEKSGPGEHGEHLESLWQALTSASAERFHAAEESTLRWLLKSMNGTSVAAETIRRYPLTWSILELVFQKIPPFSLAKSLADRRFIAVLQQTLTDASKPTSDSVKSHGSKKRKRLSPSFEIGSLRSADGCLLTAKTVFASLQSLLDRIQVGSFQSTHDKIGAEHIMSLFCTSSADSMAIMSPAFALCKLQVTEVLGDELDGQEEWIATLAKIWGLHLQSAEDVTDITTHLFSHVSTIISQLGLTSGQKPEEIKEPLRSKWARDIQTFMHESFVFPIRSAFASRKDLGPITMALEVTKGMIDISAPALYLLVSGAVANNDSRKTTNDWAREIFQAVEKAVRLCKNREDLMDNILSRSIETSLPVNVDDLRLICHTYALRENSTNWRLLARCARCDPGIFQTSSLGKDLLLTVCGRLRGSEVSETDADAIKELTGAIVESFRLARDLPGFMKLWCQQLDQNPSAKGSSECWTQLGRRVLKTGPLSSLIEAEISTLQMRELLDWAQGHQDLHPVALCVFADALAEGISSESFIDVTGRKLFDLVKDMKGSSKDDALISGPRWSVIGKTISWSSPSDREQIWDEIKDELSKVLRKSPILSHKTFEAFKLSCQAWVAMNPDAEQISEPAAMVQRFTERLKSEATEMSDIMPQFSRIHQADPKQESEGVSYGEYLYWYTHGCSRLSRLYSMSNEPLPPILQQALTMRNAACGDLQNVWLSVIKNENSINSGKLVKILLDDLISILGPGDDGLWPGEQPLVAMQMLNSMPHDVISRVDRERILAVLMEQKPAICSAGRLNDEAWKILLSLLTEIMSQPTFDNRFDIRTLNDMGSAMSLTYGQLPLDTTCLLEALGRFASMVGATVTQMAAQRDERSIQYFTNASVVLSKQQDGDEAFQLPLLQVLAAELPGSIVFRSSQEVVQVHAAVVKKLQGSISSTLQDLTSAKDPFASGLSSGVQKLCATVDAASALDDISDIVNLKSKHVQRLEEACDKASKEGDLRAWKLRPLLYKAFPSSLKEPNPTRFDDLSTLPAALQASVLKSTIAAIIHRMPAGDKMTYAQALVQQYTEGWETDGQLLAIQHVLDDLVQTPDVEGTDLGTGFHSIYGILITSLELVQNSRNFDHLSLILQTLLEKRSQSVTQWNVEATLFTVGKIAESLESDLFSFRRLCQLVEAIIKKHRLRIESHYHILVATLQSLLKSLVSQTDKDEQRENLDAHSFARLVTLICEPAAGAVARSARHNSLDSATGAAKRSAGRHMYLLLMYYVKLQLDTNVSIGVRNVLEPAVDSIFDVTQPDVRKILNDAMDASGRAILREMFKRYTKFGKWTGV